MAGAERMGADVLGLNRVGVGGVAHSAWANPAGSVLEYKRNHEVCEREACFRLLVEEATHGLPEVCSGYDRR
jgi:hypothetical protein